ncbi:tetraacyldisaccharide 4'-kinase [Kiloniella sp. EL199]|uniref:tetraacyldisaccharide 4'-kinase n=1 Tax=Kiloniella sp. EL199 TaxID=2107581 RepID=UPI000EA0CD1A|nr:tetraacyldisaccharide 4'-kinase [Kiloniella sp. EL199]
MQTPEFWKSRGFISTFLLPLSGFYYLGSILRQKLSNPIKLDVPVICVGNLTAGGSGKTPITLALADTLKKAGKNPHIVSRGYGGEQEGPLRVSPSHHSAHDVGDEPLMMALASSQSTPIWISKNRVNGAKAAIKDGADIILLDDGFQNPSLQKDLSILVVDNKIGFSNGRLIPSGPLREPIHNGLKRADAVFVIKQPNDTINEELSDVFTGKEVSSVIITPADETCLSRLINKKVFAFAGIGYPQKFYDTLANLAVDVCETKDFPDHHRYTEGDLNKILSLAKEMGAGAIFTTEKDFVKIPDKFKEAISYLPIRAVWDNPQFINSLLSKLTGTT